MDFLFVDCLHPMISEGCLKKYAQLISRESKNYNLDSIQLSSRTTQIHIEFYKRILELNSPLRAIPVVT